MKPVEQDYRRQVQEHLEQLSERFEHELKKTLAGGFCRSAVAILFEYDSSRFDESFSVALCAMTSVIRFEGQSHWFLRGSSTVAPKGIYKDEKYKEVETWGIASDILEDWLCERWRRAGLNVAGIPVLVGHHDSYFKTDIVSKAQVPWSRIEDEVKR